VAFAAKDRSSGFWLERNAIVLAAIIANDLESGLIAILADHRGRLLLRTAICTPLRRRHISLIKEFLFFFGKNELFLALNTSGFNIRHCT